MLKSGLFYEAEKLTLKLSMYNLGKNGLMKMKYSKGSVQFFINLNLKCIKIFRKWKWIRGSRQGLICRKDPLYSKNSILPTLRQKFFVWFHMANWILRPSISVLMILSRLAHNAKVSRTSRTLQAAFLISRSNLFSIKLELFRNI